MPPSWLSTALGAAVVLLSTGAVDAVPSVHAKLRQGTSPSYGGRANCPVLCNEAGPSPFNWTAYRNVDLLQQCKETLFYHFSIHDNIDDSTVGHRIFACTSYSNTRKPGVELTADHPAVQKTDNSTFEIGRWDEVAPQQHDLRMLSQQASQFVANGYNNNGDSDATNLVLFAQSVSGTMGLYVGKGLQARQTTTDALQILENYLYNSNATGGTVGMQHCGQGYDSDHIFGFMASGNYSFVPIQKTIQNWANATCVDFAKSENVTVPVQFTSAMVTSASNITSSNSTSVSHVFRRGQCTTIQVVSGDTCEKLATKCGISGADFTKYNSDESLCLSLQPLQHVCCSEGDMPDFTPKPNADGSCATHTVASGDTCSAIAAGYALKVDDIGDFNNKTWGWNGCSLLYVGAVICVSKGTTPMPAALSNAVCGPQKPNTTAPSNMDDLASLNPCPLNACCDIWGQCGITAEFCTDTNTGAPGTAKNGTNGCISNCGTDVVKSGAPSSFISLAYFEGYGLSRSCLYQDIRQIDTSAYSHIHFAFATLTSDFAVSTGDALTTYEFNAFLRLQNVHKVVSFGGWAFSTDASTYNIFREGVTPANRLKMAANIANFVKENNLDGVDIDWEYPGAPDIPGIPAGSEEDGNNYLIFLIILKNLLPGKTVSIVAPSSYWYLKAFPIKKISAIVDYIVYMTYDLHGQWDAGSAWSQEGCSSGNCLRSQVNLTETMTSLAMITKAGVPSNKVVVGITSYGRSFGMADSSCFGSQCKFTGTASSSTASPGPCTNTAGYISDAEIYDIIKNNASRVSAHFIDATSHSNILIYDNNQWVAYMDADVRKTRTTLYANLQMGGTTNWASDLESYNDPPGSSASWAIFIERAKTGNDPYMEGNRTGNWTTLDCSNAAVQGQTHIPADERWQMLDGADVWTDILDVWNNIDSKRNEYFSESVMDTIHGAPNVDCRKLEGSSCETAHNCQYFEGEGTGAVAYEIWNSFVVIHNMYQTYHTALYNAIAGELNPALKNLEDKFAPLPPSGNDELLSILLSLITLGTAAGGGLFFNSFMKQLPFFKKNTQFYDNSKDTGRALLAFEISMASTVGKGGSGSTWTAEKQDEFSDYMGQVVTAWGNVTSASLYNLFNGKGDGLDTLSTLISNGHFIEGSTTVSSDDGTTPDTESLDALQHGLAQSMFAYAIPALWRAAGTAAFILDSGDDCSVSSSTRVGKDTAKTTGFCRNNRMFYLVYPKGGSQTCTYCDGCGQTCVNHDFSIPPGVDSLDGTSFGGVTVATLVNGSLNSYFANGNQNGIAQIDPSNSGDLDQIMDLNIQAPGFIRIPVCSTDISVAAWVNNKLSDDKTNWPCYIQPSPDECEISSFVDQTSDASPSVDDCRGLVKNIEGTQGRWKVQTAGKEQHQIAQYGECKFGIEARNLHGNSEFYVGAQDIVDLINESIKQFGGSGKVGAKGDVDCNGDVNSQDVTWGLY